MDNLPYSQFIHDKDWYNQEGFDINGFDRNWYDKDKVSRDPPDFIAKIMQKQENPLNKYSQELRDWLEKNEVNNQNDSTKNDQYESEDNFSDNLDQPVRDGYENSEEDSFSTEVNNRNRSSLDSYGESEIEYPYSHYDKDEEYEEIWRELDYLERQREENKKNDTRYDKEWFWEYYYKELVDTYEWKPWYIPHWYPTYLHRNGTYFDEKGLAYGGEVYNKHGYDKDGLDSFGFHLPTNRQFYQKRLHKNGTEYDDEWYDEHGNNQEWFDREWYHNKWGLDKYGFNRRGFENSWLHKNGTKYDTYGFNVKWRNKKGGIHDHEGYDADGFDSDGYNRRGFKIDFYDRWLHKNGTQYDSLGFDINGFDRGWYDCEWFNDRGFRKNWIHKNGTERDHLGYDFSGYNTEGFQKSWLHINGTMYDENWCDGQGQCRKGSNDKEWLDRWSWVTTVLWPAPIINLTRPLIFFDTETTGVNRATDRIVELSTVKYFPDGDREIKTQRFNPTIPIPVWATEVHKITDEDVKDEPTFADKAQEISQYFSGCDVAGYNIIEFDIPIIVEEFLRASVNIPFQDDTRYMDSLKIFYQNEKRDLISAYKFYCGKELTNAHSAEADTLATVEVLNGQIKRYSLPSSISELHEICNNGDEILDYERKFKRNEEGKIVFTFGKLKGEDITQNIDYLEWMLGQDFSEFTKLFIRKIINESVTDEETPF